MILKRTTITVFVCALAVNCWGKDKTSNAQAEKPAYKVICEDADACPETVAGLLADGDSVCTSFLVKDDVVATNLHCLPENMRKAGASCKDRIRLTFPERKSSAEEIVECDKVVSVSQKAKDTPLTPDFAFLRLAKKMNRAVVKLNTQGVANNETLTIFKIDPHDEIGVLRKVTCQAAQGSMLNPLFKTAQSSVVTFVPCSIVSEIGRAHV